MSFSIQDPSRRLWLRLAAGTVTLAVAAALLVAAAPAAAPAATPPACCPCADEAAYAADMYNAFAQRMGTNPGNRLWKQAKEILIECMDSAAR
ncbi:MAG: hypothetical protein F4210_11445 [Holophagales bacterium]|nr:hypothetical protein [Holophagales bacterium]MYF96098.1 hypothetical protein [Holophagales bacterium]